jgi:hypothetical protein
VCLLGFGSLWLGASPASRDYFLIQVADAATGRGVPLVELKTVHEVAYYTDSQGFVALHEPALMGRDVFFHIASPGYEFDKDGFGYRGKALQATPGGSVVLKVRRLNIAERLYRITGEGIYRDSVLAGRATPLRQPLFNGLVFGQDSVMAIPYRGRLYWFWGDTARPSYPLGHFGTAGATSDWPARGGLDPSRGVDLDYFTDARGFSRPLCAWPGPGMKWIAGVMTVRDPAGAERLVARCDTHKSLGEILERTLIVFDDASNRFERLHPWDLQWPLFPESHPFRVRVGEDDYWYFPTWAPQPAIRVKAQWHAITNPAAYEAFTCLAVGSRWKAPQPSLDRAADGPLRYTWKADTAFIGHAEQQALIQAGRIQPDEGWLQMLDFETGAPFAGHGGSVCWNTFRRRWVMIALGQPGEIWFAEADTPVGPWVYARRVLTHGQYNFYNPTQHSFFDQANGRLIYFEGTYTAEFSGARAKTPRYDYNQIMYRLDLADARLALPAAVYRVRGVEGGSRYAMREQVELEGGWEPVEEVAFFALPPARVVGGLVPIYGQPDPAGMILTPEPPEGASHAAPLFYAWPAGASACVTNLTGEWSWNAELEGGSVCSSTLQLTQQVESVTGEFDQSGMFVGTLLTRGSWKDRQLELEVKRDDARYVISARLRGDRLKGTWKRLESEQGGTWEAELADGGRAASAASKAEALLYEYLSEEGRTRFYAATPSVSRAGFYRAAQPLCRVWRNPISGLILDREAKHWGGTEAPQLRNP